MKIWCFEKNILYLKFVIWLENERRIVNRVIEKESWWFKNLWIESYDYNLKRHAFNEGISMFIYLKIRHFFFSLMCSCILHKSYYEET